jgi:hypothetical protein
MAKLQAPSEAEGRVWSVEKKASARSAQNLETPCFAPERSARWQPNVGRWRSENEKRRSLNSVNAFERCVVELAGIEPASVSLYRADLHV